MENILEKIKNLEEHHANIGKELDALKKELQEKKVKLNVVTQWPSESDNELHINGEWAASVYRNETCSNSWGLKSIGHKASMFFADCNGTWYTESGEPIKGLFFYKPNTDNQ